MVQTESKRILRECKMLREKDEYCNPESRTNNVVLDFVEGLAKINMISDAKKCLDVYKKRNSMKPSGSSDALINAKKRIILELLKD